MFDMATRWLCKQHCNPPLLSPGPRNDAKAAMNFILKMYEALNSEACKRLYSHFTCATDTENIRLIFSAVKDTVMRIHFEEFCLA